MKIAVFTSNELRHKFVANELSKNAEDALVIAECKDKLLIGKDNTASLMIKQHFDLRKKTEEEFFSGNDFFIAKSAPIIYKEINSPEIFNAIKKFKPDAMFVFGSSIIREPLLSFLPPGRFINLHLGVSPYYRGAGTNFWPFVNNELEFVGATILHIDAGIDTGDIIAHVRPKIEADDNVHTAGCKVIQESAAYLKKIIGAIKNGDELQRIKQWDVPNPRYYKSSDFNEEALLKYKYNLENGLIENYLKNKNSGRLPQRFFAD